MDTESSVGETPLRKRVSTACEACRATKIKCQASEQPGVCRKCLDSKRECISRTGPRVRRRKAKILLDSLQSDSSTPPSGPSKTFTIDFDVPAQPEVDESFDVLRESHANFIEDLFPSESEADPSSSTNDAMQGFPTPPASSHTHSIQSLHAKPQFNVESATSLLASFRGMLASFPCIGLRPEDTVSSLAASRPFVLLAILAAASGSRTLQGHSLYDEEFRKVLGLKFVAGGERSLELMQGILIYCAWYPFHLRPKNKQAMQYIRMAGDLAHDLELDQEPPELSQVPHSHLDSEQIDRIRVYVAWYYSVSSFTLSWSRMHKLAAPFTPWTAKCCDLLTSSAEGEGDLVLSTLARISSNINAVSQAMSAESEQHRQLLLLGIEMQHRDLRQGIPSHVARSVSVKMSEFFFRIHLFGGAILKLPCARDSSKDSVPPSTERLRRCVSALKEYFDYILTLGPSVFSAFTGNDWTKFIMAIILTIRITFPLSDCPGWDATWPRSELRFDEFLAQMCSDTELTPLNTRVDVLSASRVVLGVVKAKYDRRVAALNTPAQSTPAINQGCPMLDGSLEQYFPLWDAGTGTNDFALNSTSETAPRGANGQAQMVFHDLWATMTMGWAAEEPADC